MTSRWAGQPPWVRRTVLAVVVLLLYGAAVHAVQLVAVLLARRRHRGGPAGSVGERPPQVDATPVSCDRHPEGLLCP